MRIVVYIGVSIPVTETRDGSGRSGRETKRRQGALSTLSGSGRYLPHILLVHLQFCIHKLHLQVRLSCVQQLVAGFLLHGTQLEW